jgi:hypothetical protein
VKASKRYSLQTIERIVTNDIRLDRGQLVLHIQKNILTSGVLIQELLTKNWFLSIYFGIFFWITRLKQSNV